MKVVRARTEVEDREVKTASVLPGDLPGVGALWQLDIAELAGHNIEARGREAVNRLLEAGWILLHIYTLKYREDGIWRERPMAILGRPKDLNPEAATKTPRRARQSSRVVELERNQKAH